MPRCADRRSRKRVREETQWHVFSPAVARMINPKQPDVTAAIILYNLMLWQNNRYKQTNIDGKRFCFRSLNELQQDHPYLTRTQIHQALKRAKTALKENLTITTKKKKSWFSQNSTLIATQNKDKCIRFRLADATKYGVTAAVLMANLEWQFDKHHDLPTDAAGNKYGSLSPAILAKHLPMSEDTISRTLKDLCGKLSALVPHPDKQGHYALAATFKHTSVTPEPDPAEMDSASAEVNDETAKVDSGPAEVNDGTAEVDKNEGTDSNESPNQCSSLVSNENIKVIYNQPSRATRLRLVAPVLNLSSAGLAYLDQVSKQSVSKLNLKNAISSASPKIISKVPKNALPYDDYRFVKLELPYDKVINGGSIKEWVDRKVEEFKLSCFLCRITCTSADIQKVRVFYADNQHLPDEFFDDVFVRLNPETSGLILGDVTAKPGKWDTMYFLRRVKTAKVLLKYLPQVVYEVFETFPVYEGDEGEDCFGQVVEPYDSINYAYMGRQEQIGKEYVDDES